MRMKTAELTEKIKSRAYDLGFDKIGIARSQRLDSAFLERWLNNGYQATMHWMERTAEKRCNPEQYLPGVQSIIVGAVNYYSDDPPRPDGSGQISRYAVGRDYHFVLKEMLGSLQGYLNEFDPDAQSIHAVDDAPVADKIWAQKAGIGWIGKHSNVLAKDIGSYFFIGEILTTATLEYDDPASDHCGTCTLCIDSCPTNAILDDCVVDSKQCISYRTIEYKGEYPQEWQGQNRNWIFGCDICQEVCPWNKNAEPTNNPEFIECENENTRFPVLEKIEQLSKDSFRECFKDSPIKRSKWEGIQRNIAQVYEFQKSK